MNIRMMADLPNEHSWFRSAFIRNDSLSFAEFVVLFKKKGV